MIDPASIQQIRQYPDIISIYQSYVPLKKKGRNYQGLCPFHSEKTPSFVVSPEKRIFHCFGCHESGDHIDFVMKLDNLSFTEAIKAIGEKTGIEIVETDNKAHSAEDKLRDTLQDMLRDARELFKAELPNSIAYTYLKDRGMNDEMMDAFHIGYCPDHLDLGDNFKRQGHVHELIAKTGLFYGTDEGKLGNRFRGRLIFPILDHRSRTVGFSGRILDNNSHAAKYVNSEESLLFNKRQLIYGLDHAKRHTHKMQNLILMEGFMDVIMAHQHGFKTAVATMGTALTPQHAHLLKRFSTNFYLCMDSDSAGQQAIERAYEVLKDHNCTLFAVELSEKDPADILRQSGEASFQAALDNAQHMIKFFLQLGLSRTSLDKIDEVASLVNQLIPLLRKEKDPIIQSHFIHEIAKTLRIDEKVLLNKLNSEANYVKNKVSFPKASPVRGKVIKAEESLLYLMATRLDVRQEISAEFTEALFQTDTHKRLFTLIQNAQGVDQELLGQIDDNNDRQALSRLLVDYHGKFGQQDDDWRSYADSLTRHSRDSRIGEIKDELKGEKSPERISSLLKELNELIKASQGGSNE